MMKDWAAGGILLTTPEIPETRGVGVRDRRETPCKDMLNGRKSNDEESASSKVSFVRCYHAKSQQPILGRLASKRIHPAIT